MNSATRSENGCPEKKEITTITSLIPLVQRLAGRFRRDSWSPADREDIQQEGYVGLLEAAGRFEPERGCSLTTFGGRRAAGAMMDYVRNLCRKSRERATPEFPDDDLDYRRGHGEFETPRSVESGVMLLRFREFLGEGFSGLEFLAGDEKEVLRLRFFEGKSCREAADAMRVSAATICRLERRALDRVRKNFLFNLGRDDRLEETGEPGDASTGPDSETGIFEMETSELSKIIASLTF